MTAGVAIVGSSPGNEEFFTHPNVLFAHSGMDDSHPPIVKQKNIDPYDPFEHHPQHIPYTKKDKPQTSHATAITGKLYHGAATSGASLIQTHIVYLLCPSAYQLGSATYLSVKIWMKSINAKIQLIPQTKNKMIWRTPFLVSPIMKLCTPPPPRKKQINAMTNLV